MRTQSRNNRDVSSPLDETTNGTQNEIDVTNDLQDAENVSNRGADITVPGISEKNTLKKMLVLEEKNTISDLTLTPTLLKNRDICQKIELLIPLLLIACPRGHLFLLGTILTYFCLI